MFGFGTKKAAPAFDRSKLVGIDLTATRARASVAVGGRGRPLVLDDPAEDLHLFLTLDRRSPDIGSAGQAICRKYPHLVCSNFLPFLGHARQWQSGRAALTPESALQAVFERLRGPVTAESEAIALALPAYLTAAQVKAVRELAGRAHLPVRGTAAAALVVAADRAGLVLGGSAPAHTSGSADDADDARPDWVVPIRAHAHGPAAIVVVDVDEFALTASVVGVEAGGVKMLASATRPRASLKAWKDRIIDGMSDRCVRLCRRDPRDSADAEQALYLQLDTALDRTRAGQPVTLTVRSEHWYQDLVHQPEEFDAYCTALAAIGADGLVEAVRSANLAVPPRAIWLTHAAARLPGLAALLHQNSPEQTEIFALSPTAIADATAALVPRWLAGKLPPVHLDAHLPLEPAAEKPATRPTSAANPPARQG
ncbi:hypothetical protein [Fimbriiglobus ruber]|nr:hypothetical protein [Fimbriiglobus ruber]